MTPRASGVLAVDRAATSVRTTWPPAEIRSSSSSSSVTCWTAATSPVLRPSRAISRTPCAAAVHRPELRQRDALAVAGLGQDEQVGVGLDDAHRDDAVALPGEPDADDAGRVAAHRPDLGLVEAGDHALRRGDDDVVLAGRDVDPGELVLLVDRDRPDAGRADPLELLERRLLDDALAASPGRGSCRR